MRLTKYSHACVRVERDGAVLVIDPGSFTEPAALDGANAVLITHEHPDHLDVARLGDALTRLPYLTVYTHPEVAAQLVDALSGGGAHPLSGRSGARAPARAPDRPGGNPGAETPDLAQLGGLVQPVNAGEEFSAAGFQVKAYGGWHAEVHPEIPRVVNLGFLVEDSVYHPGDSFDVPTDANVDTLFVPISGPWLKLTDSVAFVRAVAPRRAYALHDSLLSDAGGKVYDSGLARLAGCDYDHLAPGSTVDATP